MASIRELKKEINNIAGELFSECLFCRLYLSGVDPKDADIVLTHILQMQDEYLQRTNHPDGKENPCIVKAYYRKLHQGLSTSVNGIVQEIQQLNK